MPRKIYGGVDTAGSKIVGVAPGTDPTDAVNKAQLDAAAGGSTKDEVLIDDVQPVSADVDLWIDPTSPPAGGASVEFLEPGDILAGSGISVANAAATVTISADVSLTAAAASPVGAVGTVGAAATAARADHVHAGAALVHSHSESDLPSTLATDAEVTAAVAAHAAAADPHPVYLTAAEATAPSSTTPAATDGTAGAAGSGTTYARADHRHQATTGSPVALGGSASAGTGTALALATHVHPFPSAADVGAAASVHTHTQAQSHNSPDTDASAAALHHTIGTGANQAAAGNHSHAVPTIDHGATTGLADDDHTQYAFVVVAAARPGSPRVGTIWVPSA